MKIAKKDYAVIGCQLQDFLRQRFDDVRRTVATISGHFNNRESASLFDSLELLQIGLVVVPRSGGNVRVQDHAAVGVDALMHFVLELPRCTFLLGQGGVGIGATTVGLIRQFALRLAVDESSTLPLSLLLRFRLFLITMH